MKNYRIILLFLFVFSIQANAVGVIDYCFNKPIHFDCVDQMNGNYSLDGSFFSRDILYTISARRAFGQDWCENSLEIIKHVMKSEDFCIEAEVIEKNSKHLTINQVYNSKARWTYFISPPKKEQIYENIY
ncbi:MAG: hypothetical protein KDD61_09610 [Bdellovibrionales bacterium]|nr:hypothetical protein [Bdellovibrionales bacterium]